MTTNPEDICSECFAIWNDPITTPVEKVKAFKKHTEDEDAEDMDVFVFEQDSPEDEIGEIIGLAPADALQNMKDWEGDELPEPREVVDFQDRRSEFSEKFLVSSSALTYNAEIVRAFYSAPQVWVEDGFLYFKNLPEEKEENLRLTLAQDGGLDPKRITREQSPKHNQGIFCFVYDNE